MKRRIHRIANFFAFNLLFFALYLNFIHTDKLNPMGDEQTIQATAAVSAAIPVGETELLQKP